MNLVDLGTFKTNVVSKLLHDPCVVEALLGKVSEEDDVEELLLGEESGAPGHIYDFEYVPEINENTDTYLCVEAVVKTAPTDTAYTIYLYVFAYCHKKIMHSYSRDGMGGNKADILASDVDKILNGSRDFGIGRLRLLGDDIYKPNNAYYGRCIVYESEAFNRNRKLV